MFKKPFVNLKNPVFEYSKLLDESEDKKFSFLPKKVFLNADCISDNLALNVGMEVKTGQKIHPFTDEEYYLTSSVSGNITSILKMEGLNNSFSYQIEITTKEDVFDTEFMEYQNKPSLEAVQNFLMNIPDLDDFEPFKKDGKKINTIVVKAVDDDLLNTKNQYLFSKNSAETVKAIDILKKITGINRVKLLLSQSVYDKQTNFGFAIYTSNNYPNYSDYLITKDVLKIDIENGKKPVDYGVSFISIEALLNLKKAFDEGKVPVQKLVMYADEYQSKRFLNVRVGMPVEAIFNKLRIILKDSAQIVFNGFVNGFCAPYIDFPINKNISSLYMIEVDKISNNSNYACMNCGDCIRICPANISCNILVKLLEAGEYQRAENEFHLFSCFECGLCALVCPAKIPILQHINLAKTILTQKGE